MAGGMTKSQLAAELAEKSKISVKSMLIALDALAEIAYRETQNGFVIPGICKLGAAQRKPRKFRHPISGELFQIGEHLAVTATPLKKCKMRAVPQRDHLITPVKDAAPPTHASQQPTAPAAAPENDPAPQSEPASIVVECTHCGNMVAAPSEYAGMLGQCPFCNGEIAIPAVPVAPPQDDADPSEEIPQPPPTGFMGFVTFFCNACDQEIEAPRSMVGAEATCPSCGSPVFVPAEDQVRQKEPEQAQVGDTPSPKPDLRSMTIRIDLSDLA